MRLGLLGDIHGNADALKAVLIAARREHVDSLCITGDFVGYYYSPAEVLDLLSEWTTYSVRGNHEQMLAQALSAPDSLVTFESRYGGGLRCAIEQLTSEQLDYLVRLPLSVDLSFGDCKVQLAHGTPWDTDQYVYPDAGTAVMERLAGSAADLVVLGHTHYRFQRTIGTCQIANPGSVGQSRDRIPGAAWACFDTETRAYRAFAEPYDISALALEARARDPKLPYLHEVLTRR